MIKIHLDTCAIQRPIDTLNQTRLRLEAEAILGVLNEISTGKITLISSTVLELEILQNPHNMRKEHSEQVIEQAEIIVIIDEQIVRDADKFVQGCNPIV